jgi:cytosine/adenosine deaminase-related metal-dependent hydrolase
MRRHVVSLVCSVLTLVLWAASPGAQAPAPVGVKAPVHARQVKRLLIRNAMVIAGNATPAFGPVDILAEDGLIAQIGNAAAEKWPEPDAIIDATGKYVMPGIVNTHMHWHEERVGPIPIQYERNLYLAAGVTTAREVGSDFDKSKPWQAESNAHAIIAPRIFVPPSVSKGRTGSPAEIRAWIRDIRQKGADGLKIIGMDRDQLEAIMDEAHKLGMRTTTHIAVEETTAKDDVELGVNSICSWSTATRSTT